MGKREQGRLTDQVTLVAEHRMPQVMGVPQPVMNPLELGCLIVPAFDRRSAHQTIGGDPFAFHERKVGATEAPLRESAKAIPVFQQRDEIWLLGKQLAAARCLLKPSSHPHQCRALKRLDDLEDLLRVVRVREELAQGTDRNDRMHGFRLHGNPNAKSASNVGQGLELRQRLPCRLELHLDTGYHPRPWPPTLPHRNETS